jgi:predicted RNA-binding protein with RPS1 domain
MPTDYVAMIKDIHKQNQNVKAQAQMHKEWNKLRLDVVKKIDEIDKKTPSGSITNPRWWEDMMEIRRNLSKDILY